VPAYLARSLGDPAFRAWLDSLDPGAAAAPTWRGGDYALAALYFRATPERWARELEAAAAAIAAAGARPQPGVETDFEFDLSGRDGSSPWAGALRAVVPVELGGKRGARVAAARATQLAVLARIRVERTALVMVARRAVVGRGQAAAAADRALLESAALDTVVGLTLARYQEGGATTTDLARARSDAADAAVGRRSADRALSNATTSVAAAIGVDPSALDRRGWPRTPADSGCALASQSRDSLAERTLAARPEVVVALAEYEVAEAAVRFAVAESWPDLVLGPGLFFDHGVGKWITSFGLPSLVLDRHRGPIVEAEARRAVAAARVLEVQEGVLLELDVARARCAAAVAVIGAADSAAQAALGRLAAARAAFARGETGRLDVALLRRDQLRSEAGAAEAREAVVTAGQDLEAAIGVWTVEGPARWPALGRPEKGDAR
jgi:outer membrane protein, heavy metal efflux system